MRMTSDGVNHAKNRVFNVLKETIKITTHCVLVSLLTANVLKINQA